MEKKYDVFISYSRSDVEVASRITQILDTHGYTYFIDTKGISSGDIFSDVIANGIKSSRVFLFLCSQDSMQSRWLLNELTIAYSTLERNRIIPISIDGTQSLLAIPLMLGSMQMINFKSPNFESDLIKSIGRCIRGYSAIEEPTEEIRKSNIDRKSVV